MPSAEPATVSTVPPLNTTSHRTADTQIREQQQLLQLQQHLQLRLQLQQHWGDHQEQRE